MTAIHDKRNNFLIGGSLGGFGSGGVKEWRSEDNSWEFGSLGVWTIVIGE